VESFSWRWLVIRTRPWIAVLAAGGLAAACASRAPVLPTPEPGPGSPEPEVTWTVEVHADEDAVRAEEVASEVRDRFDEPVRVEKAGGSFHVRVGVFRSEREARDFVAVAREQGYRSARTLRIAPDRSGS